MINLNLKWAKNANQLHLGLCDGCKYLCVNSDGVVLSLCTTKTIIGLLAQAVKLINLGILLNLAMVALKDKLC